MFNTKTLIASLLLGILIFIWGIAGFPGVNLAPSLATALITILTGVLVLTCGQIIIKFFIEPLQMQKKCIEEISYYIVFYADIWGNPGTDSPEERKKASKKFRGLAGKIISTTTSIKFYYPFFIKFKIGIPYEKINIVKSNLIVISHSVWAGDQTSRSRLVDKNLQKVYEIEEALDLKTNLGINYEEIVESIQKATKNE